MRLVFILIAVFIVGIIIGIVIGRKREKTSGVLRIDQSDPYDGPFLFLEIPEDPRKLLNKKYVNLKVNAQSYISQK